MSYIFPKVAFSKIFGFIIEMPLHVCVFISLMTTTSFSIEKSPVKLWLGFCTPIKCADSVLISRLFKSIEWKISAFITIKGFSKYESALTIPPPVPRGFSSNKKLILRFGNLSFRKSMIC